MKVLCFHPALAPYRVDFFNLLAEQVDLEVVFLMENLKNQQLDQARIRAAARFSYRMLTRGFEIKGRLWRWGIFKEIRRVRPDVVMGYEASPITMALCLLRKWMGFRLWTHMDEAAVTIRSRRGIRAWMRNFVLRHCEGVMVPSEDAAMALKEISPNLRTVVVPIIHDTEAIRKNEVDVIAAGGHWRESLPPSWRKVLLFVGRLTPVKNLGWLIEQMPNLPREIGLVLVGDGFERKVLERKVVSLQLRDRVRFDGKLEGETVYARMSAADALVLPSTFEPYGAVVGEALQWGTPCLVSDCAGSKELICEDSGIVYHVDDIDSFDRSIRKVLRMKNGMNCLLRATLSDSVCMLCTVLFDKDGSR